MTCFRCFLIRQLNSLPKGVYSLLLLTIANLFMTFAWYGHPRLFKKMAWFANLGLFGVIMMS